MSTVILETRQFTGVRIVRSPKTVAKLARDFVGTPQQETVLVLSLYPNSEPICLRVVHIGSVDRSMVCPADVFRGPICDGASSIILMHNHPSGDVTPSRDDYEVTERVKQAGELLGIELLDHVIWGGESKCCSVLEPPLRLSS